MNSGHKPNAIVGIAWYRPDQWNALKAFCDDRDNMDPTYEIWQEGAQKAMRQLRSAGQRVVSIDFDLDEFKMWCSANSKSPNASSRSEFTVFKTRELHKGG
jgi:hypothetical protein